MTVKEKIFDKIISMFFLLITKTRKIIKNNFLLFSIFIPFAVILIACLPFYYIIATVIEFHIIMIMQIPKVYKFIKELTEHADMIAKSPMVIFQIVFLLTFFLFAPWQFVVCWIYFLFFITSWIDYIEEINCKR